LIKIFWDTANTFNFPLGEMMITSTNHYMTIRVPFRVYRLKFYPNVRLERQRHANLFKI